MSDTAISSNHAGNRLIRQVRQAILWRSGTQIVAQVIQWAATFLVIRILSPSDYGLFALTAPVMVLLAMLNGYGLAAGLVQRKEISDRDVRQLFGMLLLLNIGLALLQVVLAPLAAHYYGQPAVAPLLRAQALLYLTTPFIALPYALLSREMDFRRQAQANLLAALAGAATALGGATAGWGVWTLVAAPLALFATRAIALTIAARALVRPSFDFRGASHLAKFGGVMAAGQFFWFCQSQADVVIAGRALSPHQLGLYTTGLFLTQIFVSKVVPPLNEVAFSAYARLTDDPGVTRRAFLTAVRLVMLAALPFYVGLAVAAPPLVEALLGGQWVAAGPVVRLLALAMPFMTVQILISPVCDARGRPGIGAGNGAIGALFLAIGFLVGVRYGIIGLATAWLVSYPCYLAVSLYRARDVIGARAHDLAVAIRPAFMAAVAMGGVVVVLDTHIAYRLAALPRLALLVGVGALVYAAWLTAFHRPILKDVRELLRK